MKLATGQIDPPARGVPAAPKPLGQAFASLDFLRGLSAFAVLLSHTAATVSSDQPVLAFNWGSLAVDVFMLISGFLMMWHFYERRNLGERWGSFQACQKFYVRRFFRIAPLYYCLLLIVYLFHRDLQQWTLQNHLALHQPVSAGPHDLTGFNVTAVQVLSHFSFLFGFIPRYAQSNPLPDWSIGLEMQFYLFFPFLALLLVRSQFVGGVLLLLAGQWLATHLFGVGISAEPKLLGVFPFPTFLPLKINTFLVGMLLAAGLFEKENPAKRTLLLLLALMVAGIYMEKFLLICFLFSFYEIAAGRETGFPALDQAVKMAGGLLGCRLFKFMADASYGVYLIHIPLLILLVRGFTLAGPFPELSPGRRFLLCLGVVIPLVYALAFLAHKWVESPGIQWGRKIVNRLGKG